MSNIVPFDFEGAAVRVVDRGGDPWFVLADVCRVLEIGNSADAARRLDDDEKGVDTIDTPGGLQEMVVINESGLYSLILTSRKDAAKRFKKWVTADVLPTIRKTGGYGQINVRDPAQLTQVAIQLIEVNRELQHRAERAEKLVEAAAPKTNFYDQFVNAEGLFGLHNAARALGQGPQKFVQMLKQGYLFYEGGTLVPKVRYREMGIFEVKCTYVDDKARYQTYVTPRGMTYFAKKLGVDGLQLAGDAA